MTVEEVVAEVMKDRQFYSSTAGGVTISGGEPFLQHEFVAELLSSLHDRGIHTVVETAGEVAWASIEESLPHLDLIYFDMKAADRDDHKRLTGVYNDRIIKNLSNLRKLNFPMMVRIPVIPGMNDSDKQMSALASMLAYHSVQNVELLVYHEFGSSKYEYLGREYLVPDIPVEKARDRVIELVEVFKEYGIQAIHDMMI